MTEQSSSNIVDYVTLAVAIAAPVVTIWSIRRAEREKFNLHIDWIWFGPDEPVSQAPFLYVQNLTTNSVVIAAIQFYRGWLFRKQASETALHWDEPDDLQFPYTIKPGELKRFCLSEDDVEKQFDKAGVAPWLANIFRRPVVWVGVTTIGGSKRFAKAHVALPWKKRPSWSTLPDADYA